jgi:adenine deaminase
MKSTRIEQRTKALIDVAMGREIADIVIRGGKWVCVQSGEIIPEIDIAVKDERIAFVGSDASHTIGDSTRIIEAEGKYLVPGLLDGHMHVESGMTTVSGFVRAVSPRGTTGMFIDPHEIANVFGLNGVKLMVDESRNQPIHVWVQVPSCVPSAPGLENPGASIDSEDVAEALKWEGIIGLGEMMNFPGVILGDAKMLAEMAATRAASKTIGGHYASPDIGLPFHGYVAGGPQDDHEGTTLEDAVARVRQGMKSMLRYGSGWLDVEAQIKAITELGMDSRHFILCTDDSHAETLVKDGHMDRVVRHTIELGVEPVTAIQMATLNTAEHFNVSVDVGQIAPGRFADILLVSDLHEFQADLVIAKGKLIARDGDIMVDSPAFPYPDWIRSSVNIGKELSGDDFRFNTSHDGIVSANVIGIVENQAPTKHLIMEIVAKDGEIPTDFEQDICKIAVVERHFASGSIQIGLVHGFGFDKSCAIATTVAHDSHHLIVVGTDDGHMAEAANQLQKSGGGQIVICNGEVIGAVELPIAGLMSNEPVATIAKNAATVLEGFRSCGCKINNPNMQLSLLGLVVIPELRISDKGLVDATNFQIISVINEES